MVLTSAMYVSTADALNLIIKHLETVVPDGLKPDPNLSFIEMGLDSLLMASLELYLQKHFFDIRPGFLIQHKTPRECAEKLSSLQMKLSVQKVEKMKFARKFPLSQAQKRLIFSASKHFEQLQIKVPKLDVQRFANAWKLVSERHSILRTSLSLDGQEILDNAVDINARFEDDLLKHPLRIQLINEDTIQFEYHHALIDGTSINLLMSELYAAYEDPESIDKHSTSTQYFEYCLFEEKYLNESNKELSKIVDYWSEELKDFEEVFENHSPTRNSTSIEWKFEEKLFRNLAFLASENELTIFALISGIIRVLFYKLYDADDLILGFPVEQRLHSDFEQTIGLFMNFNVCRVKLNSTLTFIQFISEAAQKTKEAIAHGHLPFNQLVHRLQSNGILESEEQLLQLIVVNDKQISGQTQVEVKTTGHSMLYPQIWYIQHTANEESLKLRIEFDTDKFTVDCIREEIRLFEVLCQTLLENPFQQIKSISLNGAHHLKADIPVDFLHCILNKLEELEPNKIVLKSHNQEFGAQKFLDEIWNASRNLREVVGDQEEVFIALMLPRSPELIICLFGAWLNGYIVIPLNCQQDVVHIFDVLPPKTFVIANQTLENHSNVIFVNEILEKRRTCLKQKLPTFKPNDLCYCTFTSGSTGEPKLVMSERVGLSNLLRNYTQKFGYNEESIVYQVVNPAFDIFFADVVASLANGALLLLAKHQIPSTSEIEKNAITHAYIMPAFLPKMCSDKDMEVLAKLKVLMFGGEPINENFVRKALCYNVPMVQLFGFTEHAIYTNYQWIKQPSNCSLIGHPFVGTKATVVDKDGHQKPDGFKGNLLSIGLGVFRGYFGVETDIHKFNSHRAFSTGDICRKNPNGEIEFLGRKDEVVKLNGQKVHIGRVDQLFSKLNSLQQAATIGMRTKEGSQKLIVFVVSTSTTEEILSELKEKHPDWTLPILLHSIEALPLNSNGKVDKRKLTLIANQIEDNDVIEEKSPNENDLILNVFQQFLGQDYKLDDDFLNAGIDSIQLLQVAQALEDQLNMELDVGHAFRSRNAREWLKTAKYAANNSSERLKEGPVTWNQEQVWFLCDFDPEHADSYKIKLKLNFVDKIDKSKFIKAINRIVKENESLRVKLQLDSKNNQLKQVVLPHQDDRFLTSGGCKYPSKYPISLEFQSDNSVRIDFEHSTVDGYSLRLIVEDLFKYYTNPTTNPRSSRFSPIKFAKDQRNRDFVKEVEFFRKELTNSINEQLPTELPRPLQSTQKAKHERLAISTNNFDKLVDCNISIFYFTLTAYLKQLSEETNQASLTIGIPFANRSSKNTNAVGYFANALPIRVNLEGKNDRELVEYVREKVLETLLFSSIPFSLLVRQLQPKRNHQVNPIFQRMLMFEDFHFNSNGSLFSVQEVDSIYVKFDQTWHAHRNEHNQLEVHVEYNQDLFTEAGVKKSLKQFEQHFNQLVAAFTNSSHIRPTNDDITNKLFQFLKEELAQPTIELTETSNFFELGLHSLNSALLASRIRSELNLNCSTKQIFEHQTIKELASMLNLQINKSYEVSHLQATILRFMKENQSDVFRKQYCDESVVNLKGMNRKNIEKRIFRMIQEQEALRTQFFVKDEKFFMRVFDVCEKKLPYCVKSEDFRMGTVFIELRENDELYIRLSHLISDRHSVKIMLNYLEEPPNLGASFSAFNSKFNERCKEDEEKNAKFWKATLNIENGLLFRDHHVKMPTKSASFTLSVPKSYIIEEVKRSKISPNAFLLYKLAETLKHWQPIEDQDKELYIAVAKDMRSSIFSNDFSQTIGFFTQTLPIPCKHKSLNELNELLFDAYEHAFVRYEQLLEFSKHSTLFEVMMVLDFEDEMGVNSPPDVNGKFPLTFFNTDQHVLPSINQSTSFVDPIERIQLFARNSPNFIAIQTASKSLTYHALCQKMNQISGGIKKKFTSLYGNLPLKDAVIVIVGQNCVQTLVTCLACMNAGAAYLPVDESLNSSTRIRQIFEETRAKLIISKENFLELKNWISFEKLWAADFLSGNLHSLSENGTDLAYVIYTSGTTGKQKAVQIERNSLWNTIQDASEFFEVDSKDCVYQFTKFCFDNSVLEVFVALCNGARLFVQEGEFDVNGFCDNIEDFKITHAFLYPGLVDTFTDEQLKCLRQLKFWIVGAEKLGKPLMERALKFGIRTIQNYGPTETTCYALRRRMQKDDDPQNLGTPVPGLTCILSTQDVPSMAAPRELLISGIGLMRGYIGDMNQKCFVQVNGRRFYKTGDLVRQTRNGDILFIGRADNVVKVRGFRVDLNEVESTMLKFDEVKQVKILTNSENIFAYFVGDNKINIDELKSHCIVHLPRYAVPNLFCQVEKMPLTSNNKIDNNALMKLNTIELSAKEGALTEVQCQISKIWSEMFGRQVGINESFFEIGGNSLSAQRMLNRLEAVFGVRLSIYDLMMNPTIKEVEALLKRSKKTSPSQEISTPNQNSFH